MLEWNYINYVININNIINKGGYPESKLLVINRLLNQKFIKGGF